MNAVKTIQELAELAKKLKERIEFHSKAARELSEEAASIRQIEKQLTILVDQRKNAIQRRWKSRRELRDARSAVEALIKSGAIKKIDYKKCYASNADDLEKQIIKNSSLVDRAVLGSGIYFLIYESKVVYVGQSVNTLSRIGGHKDKTFDRFAFIPCRQSQLNETERSFINLLLPELNADQTTEKIRKQQQ